MRSVSARIVHDEGIHPRRQCCSDLLGGPEWRHKSAREQTRLGMSVINWGEVFYVLAKKSGEDRTRQVLNALRKGIDVFVVGLAQAELAASSNTSTRSGMPMASRRRWR